PRWAHDLLLLARHLDLCLLGREHVARGRALRRDLRDRPLPGRDLSRVAQVQRHVPRADRVRGHGSRGGGDLTARLADARPRVRLRGRAVRVHALVLAVRPPQLHGRVGLRAPRMMGSHGDKRRRTPRAPLDGRSSCEALSPGTVARSVRQRGLGFPSGTRGFLFEEAIRMAMVETENRATSDPAKRKEVLQRIMDERVEFLLLWFSDIEGHLKSFAITPSEIEGVLDVGMGFDGSSIIGFNAIEESDMVAIPDPDTYQLMPAREGEMKMARMICDIVTPDGKPYEGDPRYVLRRALDRMHSLGFDTFNVGPELEYFL